MMRLFHRLRDEEHGFALVTAVMLLSIMTVLMVVSLSAGQSAHTISERGSRYNKTLVVAEAGVNDAVTRLGQSRTTASACPIGTSTTCSVEGGQYQVSWTQEANGAVRVTSTGYYPTKVTAQISRQVQVDFAPKPEFRYALFSAETLEIKNNEIVFGDVWGTSGVNLGNGAIVCGSITNATGDVTMGNGSQVVKSYSSGSKTCSGKSGDVWTSGSISNSGTIAGNAKASAPSSTTCSSTSTQYQITGGTILGNATACGRITSTVTGISSPGTNTSLPSVSPLPVFTFDPVNYPDLICYPSGGTCGPTTTSATAVTNFAAVSRSNMKGTYAIWQTSPTASTRVDLSGLSLSGDLTIVTNAPIDLGNTSVISSTVPAEVVIVSTYIPPVGTSCAANGGDCSIYGKNGVSFDSGSATDPNDGVVGLLYTPGKMAFKNSGNAAEGALYAGSIDLMNGFTATYNPRVERIVGFGTSLEQTLWQELAV